MSGVRTMAMLVVLVFANVAMAQATLVGKFSVNGQQEPTMDPGEGARWTIGFSDSANGAPVTAFEPDHEKPMHLIVVSEDLSSFAHVHPGLAASTGVFTLDANAPSDDPDNQDAPRVVTRPGTHFLFAEVHPAGGAAQQCRFALKATGEATPTTFVVDPVDADGAIVKQFDASGQPATGLGEYRVSLQVMAMKAEMVHLTFQLERRAPDSDPVNYIPVTDLEPWLGMTAHAVLIGAQGATAADRVFRHLHAGHGDHGARAATGPDVLFMMHGDDVPPAGRYRVWLQVKRLGRVLTLPFSFEI